jgi:hypothetical protein
MGRCRLVCVPICVLPEWHISTYRGLSHHNRFSLGLSSHRNIQPTAISNSLSTNPSNPGKHNLVDADCSSLTEDLVELSSEGDETAGHKGMLQPLYLCIYIHFQFYRQTPSSDSQSIIYTWGRTESVCWTDWYHIHRNILHSWWNLYCNGIVYQILHMFVIWHLCKLGG